jgi:hypothetical protein
VIVARDLGNSRGAELESNAHRTGSKSHRLTVLWKIGKTGLWRKAIGIWSGLSESNRHLNLGEVREVNSNALERRHLAFWVGS